MKRFMKGCAATALIFAVLGSMLAFVGGRVAGRTTVSQVVEAVTRGKVHVDPGHWWNWHFWVGDASTKNVTQLIEALEVVDYGDYSGHDTEHFYDHGYEHGYDHGDYVWEDALREGGPVEFIEKCEITNGHVDKFCPGDDIRKLELDLGGCILNYDYSYNGYLYLEADNASKFQSNLKGNTLHVKVVGKSTDNWTDMGSCQVTLYIPIDYEFEEVEISLGAGYVVFGDLRAQEVSLEVGAGEIDFNYLEASKMDISVGAGSVIIGYMEVNELEAEIGMGSLQADGDIYRKADVECSMGYVALYLAGEERDFNYKLDGAMGNIEIGDNNFSGFAQEKWLDNGASKDIEVECSMGNISILFTD